mgnify:CR=1 FL=1
MSDSDDSDNYEPVEDLNESLEENPEEAAKSPESTKEITNTPGSPEEAEDDEAENDEVEDVEAEDGGEENDQDDREPAAETVRPRAPVDRLTQLPLARIKNMLKHFDPEWKGQTSDAAIMLVMVGQKMFFFWPHKYNYI